MCNFRQMELMLISCMMPLGGRLEEHNRADLLVLQMLTGSLILDIVETN
jgi:hypothetical protein